MPAPLTKAQGNRATSSSLPEPPPPQIHSSGRLPPKRPPSPHLRICRIFRIFRSPLRPRCQRSGSGTRPPLLPGVQQQRHPPPVAGCCRLLQAGDGWGIRDCSTDIVKSRCILQRTHTHISKAQRRKAIDVWGPLEFCHVASSGKAWRQAQVVYNNIMLPEWPQQLGIPYSQEAYAMCTRAEQTTLRGISMQFDVEIHSGWHRDVRDPNDAQQAGFLRLSRKSLTSWWLHGRVLEAGEVFGRRALRRLIAVLELHIATHHAVPCSFLTVATSSLTQSCSLPFHANQSPCDAFQVFRLKIRAGKPKLTRTTRQRPRALGALQLPLSASKASQQPRRRVSTSGSSQPPTNDLRQPPSCAQSWTSDIHREWGRGTLTCRACLRMRAHRRWGLWACNDLDGGGGGI